MLQSPLYREEEEWSPLTNRNLDKDMGFYSRARKKTKVLSEARRR